MAISQSLVFALVLLLFSAFRTHGLQVAPNSPCKSKCASENAATTEDSIVCIDSDYTTTSAGSTFQQCIECELGSSAADPKTGTTDVMWALYNMRYTLSSCMFGFPTEKVSLSSPCQVSCTPLSNAIESGLAVNATIADLSFCAAANFSTAKIQQCVFCYGLMDQQRYLANFLQAINIACQNPPSPSHPFTVAGSAIFNSTTIQPPATSSASSSSSSRLHGTSLALAIALPIVFGFLLLVLTCIACFFSARRRRREMAAHGKMRRVHEVWGDSPVTPRADQFSWEQTAMDMQQMQGARGSQRYSYAPQYSYRDDVGPGTGQIQDHSLHDQYFAPPSKVDGRFPVEDDGLSIEVTDHMHQVQHEREESPNLLHSPMPSHVPFEVSVARGEPATGDKKDSNHDWI